MEAFQYALQLFHSGGLVMYPLLLLSIFTLAIAIERFGYPVVAKAFDGDGQGKNRQQQERIHDQTAAVKQL